eukprot:7460369-Pyramimonas_sp.AAC.1
MEPRLHGAAHVARWRGGGRRRRPRVRGNWHRPLLALDEALGVNGQLWLLRRVDGAAPTLG